MQLESVCRLFVCGVVCGVVVMASFSCVETEVEACDATSATVVGTCAADVPCTIKVSGDDDVTMVVDSGALPAGLVIDGGTITGTVADVTTESINLTLTRTACGDDEKDVLLLIDVKAPECATDDDCRVRLIGIGGTCDADSDCDGALCAPGFADNHCVPNETSCQTGTESFSVTSVDGAEITNCTIPTTRCDGGICPLL